MLTTTTLRVANIAKAVVLAAAVAAGAAAAAAPAAAIELRSVGGAMTTSDGSPTRQAGAHPDVRFRFELPPKSPEDPSLGPVEQAHRLRVDLPPGLVGDPTAAPTCDRRGLSAGSNGNNAKCPVGAQVGIANVFWAGFDYLVPVYNVVPPEGTPGLFAFNILGAVIQINPTVRPGDYGITIASDVMPQAAKFTAVDVTLWGVPADRAHDAQRFATYDDGGSYPPAASQSPRQPFLTAPTSCPGTPETTTAWLDGWRSKGEFDSASFSSDFDGEPFITTGCERLPFAPSVEVEATSRVADAPTGLNVDVKVPQNDAPDGLASAHVRKVSVALPLGMSVSPSSAAGLGACLPGQIGLGTADDPSCPRSAKLGTVEIDTPLLEESMQGDVLLAQPDNNPFGSLLAVYLVAKGNGVTVKLPGRIDADAVTGQLTAVFDNNPELPFSALRVRFDGGPQAALATPPTCGNHSTDYGVVSWATDNVVRGTSSMRIDEGCEPRGFAPAVSAGMGSQQAGSSSPFSLTITRPDRQQYLSRVETTLPAGLLARLKDAEMCGDAQAAAGTCSEASQVGYTSVLSGPGSTPLPVRGRVHLTGGYGDAPFGLSIVVPTAGQAGPFDLGNIVVRAKIYVDRNDAHVTVKADPLPTIVRGFPLRMQRVSVVMDRPGFMLSPTGCKASDVRTVVQSVDGASHGVASPFRLTGCGDLKQEQKLAVRMTNKAQQKPGRHPGLRATLTDKERGTNLRKVVVKLPLSVALDPDNAKALCKPEQRAARACPSASIVGSASAQSVLPSPLKAPVYFIEGTRKTASGKIARTTPKLWIPLRANGVTIDVDASSSSDTLGRLVTTFDGLPDAPIKSFELRLDSGKNGILQVTSGNRAGTCGRDRTVEIQLRGHNGKVLNRSTRSTIDGCPSKKKSAKTTSGAAAKPTR